MQHLQDCKAQAFTNMLSFGLVFSQQHSAYFLGEYQRRGGGGGSKQSDKDSQRSYFACVFFVSELLGQCSGSTFLLSVGICVLCVLCLFVQSTMKYEKCYLMRRLLSVLT